MVEVKLELTLEPVDGVVYGTGKTHARRRLETGAGNEFQQIVYLSISEDAARKLWQELGRKLRNVNREEEAGKE